MQNTRVKICGFTQLKDALHACNMGVDAIGLVFCENSPRNIEPSVASQISRALPAFVTSVALFMNETEQQIQEILNEVPIDCIQFHGDEDAEFCRQFNLPYIKAIAMGDETDIIKKVSAYHDARGVLLDSHASGQVGGTGETFDWNAIPKNLGIPLILAGGLTVNNVAEAVRIVRPYAVDVSSGVERGKGLKDAALVTAFINEVKNVE